jgi:CRP-like cAMP-binding protein
MEMIDPEFLLSRGAAEQVLSKKEMVYLEGDTPKFFYLVAEGEVRLYNTSVDGKEFIQGIFRDGQSFGEPPLLIGQPYPAHAAAVKPTRLIKLPLDKFSRALVEEPGFCGTLLKVLAERIYRKTTTTRDIIHSNPRQRLLAFLQSEKEHTQSGLGRLLITYTRQDIANQTGLRVETVIRTLRQMHDEGVIEIVNRKIYY